VHILLGKLQLALPDSLFLPYAFVGLQKQEILWRKIVFAFAAKAEKVPQFITPRVEAVPPAERHELFETQLHIVARFLHIFKEVPHVSKLCEESPETANQNSCVGRYLHEAQCFAAPELQ